MEIEIHISSESNRNNDLNNTPSKFKTIFDKVLTFGQNKTYVFGLDKRETITYSWYNFSEQYKTIKFDMELFQKKKIRKKLLTHM